MIAMMLLLERWLFAAAMITRIKRQVLMAVDAGVICTKINTPKFLYQKLWSASGATG